MRIMISNGSPKRAASSTLHITRSFLGGMNAIGKNGVRGGQNKTISMGSKNEKFMA